jgi:hypothetical protein
MEIELKIIGYICVYWIDMAQDRKHCWDIINKVMKFRAHKHWKILEKPSDW